VVKKEPSYNVLGCNFDSKRKYCAFPNNGISAYFNSSGKKASIMHSRSSVHYHVVPQIRTGDLCAFHNFAVTPNNTIVDAGICSHLCAGAYDNIPNIAALRQLDTFLYILTRARKRVPERSYQHPK
jgi:hypothetical protein